jgi:hypothetical protein
MIMTSAVEARTHAVAPVSIAIQFTVNQFDNIFRVLDHSPIRTGRRKSLNQNTSPG